MMNHHNHQDQAEGLRRRAETSEKSRSGKYPSRSEVHKKKPSKEKKKLRYPLINFLALCFIMLIILIFTVTIYTQKHTTVNTNNGGYEYINEDSSDNPEPSDNTNSHSASDQAAANEITPKQKETKQESTKSAAAVNEENKKDTKKVQEDKPANVKKEEQAKTEPKTAQSELKDEKKTAKDKSEKAGTSETADKEPNKNVKVVQHTVLPQETLYRISMKYYKSRSGEEKIRKWNKLQDNEVYAGQVLEIPL
ncbi:LysM peptidoglycan-binding domain-containing protein [Metabacillus sp. RGM 3146]|uniref:LysM peptidoglycan-binding domain-containing protein n=1 Tax=Metabacillus sp. RGM 3146 TaxID=3401092 RepID=UPI003B9C1FF6